MPEMTLDKNSSKAEIDNWVSLCIRHNRREGKTGEEASGKCINMAREQTGKRLGK